MGYKMPNNSQSNVSLFTCLWMLSEAKILSTKLCWTRSPFPSYIRHRQYDMHTSSVGLTSKHRKGTIQSVPARLCVACLGCYANDVNLARSTVLILRYCLRTGINHAGQHSTNVEVQKIASAMNNNSHTELSMFRLRSLCHCTVWTILVCYSAEGCQFSGHFFTICLRLDACKIRHLISWCFISQLRHWANIAQTAICRSWYRKPAFGFTHTTIVMA